jgi:hypothetical protein
MIESIRCAQGLDAHSKAILLTSLLALMRGNATFFQMTEEVQMNLMWLAEELAQDVLAAAAKT